jgi:hypothetical protein
LDIWRGLGKPVGELEPAVLVELLRTLQQLILWQCPVDVSGWRPLLGAHLASPLAVVRRAALHCMRAMAEKKPVIVLEQGWDRILLAQVDRERGFDGCCALVRHTFEACVDAVLPSSASEEEVVEGGIVRNADGWTATWHVLDTCKRCLTQNRLPSDSTFSKVRSPFFSLMAAPNYLTIYNSTHCTHAYIFQLRQKAAQKEVEGDDEGGKDDEVITIEQRGADKVHHTHT